MLRPPTRSKRTYTLFPYTTLFRSYLAQLTGSGSAMSGARDFAKQIYDLALLRELVGVGRELVENALDTSEDVDPLSQIEAAEVALYRVSEGEGEGGSVKSFLQADRKSVRVGKECVSTWRSRGWPYD